MALECLKWGAPHFRHYGERYKMVSDWKRGTEFKHLVGNRNKTLTICWNHIYGAVRITAESAAASNMYLWTRRNSYLHVGVYLTSLISMSAWQACAMDSMCVFPSRHMCFGTAKAFIYYNPVSTWSTSGISLDIATAVALKSMPRLTQRRGEKH